MTREQFISGVTFKVQGPTYKGANTFTYNAKDNCVLKQSRSSIDERIVFEDYACNVLKVGRVWFVGFTYVIGTRVVVRYKFEDLVEFKEGV
jgi:hypothetical protein